MKVSGKNSVQMLMGKKNLDFFMKAYPNQREMALGDKILNLWNDGTLTKSDEKVVLKQYPEVIFVDWQTIEEQTFFQLKSYPACLDLRKKFVFARRLFDMTLHVSERLVSLDSDVVFKEKIDISPLWDVEYPFISMTDHHNAYAFFPRIVNRIYRQSEKKLLPIERANMGIFAITPHASAIDFFEDLFNKPDFKHAIANPDGRFWWMEQTAFSYLGNLLGAYQIPSNVGIVPEDKETPFSEISKHRIAHLCGKNKRFLDEWLTLCSKKESLTSELCIQKADPYLLRSELWGQFFNKVKTYL